MEAKKTVGYALPRLWLCGGVIAFSAVCLGEPAPVDRKSMASAKDYPPDDRFSAAEQELLGLVRNVMETGLSHSPHWADLVAATREPAPFRFLLRHSGKVASPPFRTVVALLGTKDERLFDLLMSSVGTGDCPPNVALRLVSTVGTNAVPALMSSSSSSNDAVRLFCAKGLGLYTDSCRESIPTLCKLAADPVPVVAVASIKSLKQFGPDERSEETLGLALADERELVRAAARGAIPLVSSADGKNVALMLNLVRLKDLSASERAELVRTLGRMRLGPSSVKALAASLQDREPALRAAALDALAYQRQLPDSVRQVLLQLHGNGERNPRLLMCLSRCDKLPEDVEKVAGEFLLSESLHQRRAGAAFFARRAADRKSVSEVGLGALRKALSCPDSFVRCRALLALRDSKRDQKTADAVAELLTRENNAQVLALARKVLSSYSADDAGR